MSDEEHSESEFYYPEVENEGYETVFCQFNEVQSNDLYEERDSQKEIDSFIRERKSLNTVKKTASDMNSFNRYLAEINKQYLNILHLPAQELDRLLSKFFKDIRKFNGEEYEPNTISSFERSIERFLSDNKSQFNILRDKKFEMSRQVLAAKRKRLVNKACVTKPRLSTH